MLFSKKIEKKPNIWSLSMGMRQWIKRSLCTTTKRVLGTAGCYELVKDQLIDEGVSRQNLATFCQTYMEPEAVKL